jgi:hypothetical protein
MVDINHYGFPPLFIIYLGIYNIWHIAHDFLMIWLLENP